MLYGQPAAIRCPAAQPPSPSSKAAAAAAARKQQCHKGGAKVKRTTKASYASEVRVTESDTALANHPSWHSC